jgi:hypothetical protein
MPANRSSSAYRKHSKRIHSCCEAISIKFGFSDMYGRLIWPFYISCHDPNHTKYVSKASTTSLLGSLNSGVRSTPVYYIFALAKFKTISLPVTQTVLHSVGKSKVLDSPSAKPKNNIGGIHPLAYSSAKQASSILYCLTVPR